MNCEDLESLRFVASLVAMHAIITKAPLAEDSDLPNMVASGAVDYADCLLDQLYGDDSSEG